MQHEVAFRVKAFANKQTAKSPTIVFATVKDPSGTSPTQCVKIEASKMHLSADALEADPQKHAK